MWASPATELLPTQCPFLAASVRPCRENRRAPRHNDLAGRYGFRCGAMSWMSLGICVGSAFETALISRSSTSPRELLTTYAC